MKNRLYVDEVGNPDLESSADENHRFLCLAGVIIELDYVSKVISPQLESLKVKYFSSHPDEPIILHRKELVRRKPPFTVLRDPEIERRFNEDILLKLNQWEYSVIVVIIDKHEHAEKYTTWRYDPYHYCQEILIERYRLFLNINKSKGDIMFESRGLLAHPARRWCFRNFYGMDDNKQTFGDRVIDILEREKFFRYKGEITSYGVKKLP